VKPPRMWQWPNDVELAEWEAKLAGRKRSLSPGHQLMMVRAIRGQRKSIERLARLLSENKEDRPMTDPTSARVARAEQEEIAKALRFEQGDRPGEWWIPAEPGPLGPFTFAEAVREFMAFNDRCVARDASALALLRSRVAAYDALAERAAKALQVKGDTMGRYTARSSVLGQLAAMHKEDGT
jgi:hypothetical protein